MEETWGSRGVEWGDGVQTQRYTLRIFPQYPFSPLSGPTHHSQGSFLSFYAFFFSLVPRRHFSEESPSALPAQPGVAPLPSKKGSSPQTTCFPALVQGGERTYTGSLVLGAEPFGTELTLDLPGKEGRALTLELGNSSHHRGCGQTGLASPNPLGLQDTCAVVTC